MRRNRSTKYKKALVVDKMTQPNSGHDTPKEESPEMASPVQWTRGGTAGRITAGGERDAQLTAVVTWSRRHSSPSNSSEPSDQQSASAVASASQEQAQQRVSVQCCELSEGV